MNKRSSGFTLLELLVALAIFTVMVTITYTGLAQILDNQDYIDQKRSEQRALVMAIMRIEDDLNQIRNRGVREIDGTNLPAFIGRPSDDRAASLPMLEFTRGGVPVMVGMPQQTGLQRVAYRINNENELIRMSWPVLDRSPVSQPVEVKLLGDVSSLEVRFFREDKRWSDSWPPLGEKNTATLPRGLELTLTYQDRELTRLFMVEG